MYGICPGLCSGEARGWGWNTLPLGGPRPHSAILPHARLCFPRPPRHAALPEAASAALPGSLSSPETGTSPDRDT